MILVALPGSGLQHLAEYICRNYEVKTLYFEHDLSRKEECYRLYEEVLQSGWPLNILINNAGIGGTHEFEDRDAEFYHRQIELNVVAPTLLTHLLLHLLEKNNPSYILNVSSMAGLFHLPMKQVYGGTKSYLISFSKSLRCELKRKKIYVSTVCPGGMNTTPMLTRHHLTLHGISKWSVMDPEEVAAIAIRAMLENKEQIIPGFWNRLFIYLNSVLPKWLKDFLTEREMRKNSKTIIRQMHTLKTAV